MERTGEIIWQDGLGQDAGRGVAADIDPRYDGAECWCNIGGLRRGDTGEIISNRKPDSCNFTIYWDADPLAELLDHVSISKWNWNAESTDLLLKAERVVSNNGTKGNPCLSGDIFRRLAGRGYLGLRRPDRITYLFYYHTGCGQTCHMDE